MHKKRLVLISLLIVILACVPFLLAVNDHGLPDSGSETRAMLADAWSPFTVATTCVPVVPVASATVGAFACKAYVADGAQLRYVHQAAVAVGPLTGGDGTFWLAVHKDLTSSVGGWTRQARTHYLWQKSAAVPTTPVGGLLLARVTVAGGVITDMVQWALANPVKNRHTVDVEDFRTAEGVDGDVQAIQRAINYVAAREVGGTVTFSREQYLINAEILVPYTGISQQRGIFLQGRSPGGGGTRLYAQVPNIAVVRWSHSFGGMSGMQIHGNGQTGTTCLRLAPEDEAQTTELVCQIRNTFRDNTLYNCTDGLVLKAGPVVGGGTCGSWDNEFTNFGWYFNTRCVFLAPGPDQGVQGNGNHRNKFWGGKCGGGGVTNTGVHIRAGGENRFYGVMFENITTGTAPLAVPTAIVVENNDGLSVPVTNFDNSFDGCGGENFTRALNNSGVGTSFVNWPVNNPPLINFGSTRPSLQLTQGNTSNQYLVDAFYTPLAETGLLQLAMNWQKHQAMLNEPYNGVAGAQRAHWFDQRTNGTNGGAWKLYTPAPGDVTNIAGGAFNQTNGGVWQMSGRVVWDFRGQFQATNATNPVTIRLPFAPDDTQYTTVVASLAAWRYPIVIKGDTGVETVAVGQLTGSGTNTFLSIAAPTGNWGTAGSNNSVWIQLEYTAPLYILP